MNSVALLILSITGLGCSSLKTRLSLNPRILNSRSLKRAIPLKRQILPREQIPLRVRDPTEGTAEAELPEEEDSEEEDPQGRF